MPAHRFSKDQRLQLRAQIADMRLRQRSTYEIGKALDISQSMVMYHLKAIEEEWREQYMQSHDRKRSAELQRLDRVEREAWDAWFKSLKPTLKTVRSEEEIATPDEIIDQDPEDSLAKAEDLASRNLRPRPRAVKSQVTTEENLGDPRYLEIIRKCVETRAKILGLEPSKTITVDIRAQAEKAARYLGKDVEEVIKRAEEIAARAWSGGS